MRLAPDTNLIVRYLMRDDEAQFAAAAKVFEGPDELFLSLVALCETVWVLRRTFRRSHGQIATALFELVAPDKVTCDRSAFEAGLDLLRQGGDFADGCIAHEARKAACDRVLTFDQGFAKLLPDFANHLLS